jgi:hypothetical protein
MHGKMMKRRIIAGRLMAPPVIAEKPRPSAAGAVQPCFRGNHYTLGVGVWGDDSALNLKMDQ